MTRKKGNLQILIEVCPGVEANTMMLHTVSKLVTGKFDTVIFNNRIYSSLNEHNSPEYRELKDDLNHPDIRHQENVDIDTVLLERPRLVIIKKLARALKRNRPQEIVEIIENGIDVIASVRVSEIESLVSIIEDITGKTVHATVPDFILEMAVSVQCIDSLGKFLPSQDHSHRGTSITDTIDNDVHANVTFTTLRELALHYTASLLNKKVLKQNSTYRNWKPQPAFLTAISSSPYSQFLIRWTRKTAFEQRVPWLAVYIQTVRELSEKENNLLKKNMKLVNELGAELIISLDENVAKGIIRVAKQYNVSHIVIGKPLGYKTSGFFQNANIIDSLISQSGEIDIFVVSEQNIRPKKRRFFSRLFSWFGAGSIKEYVYVSLLLTGLVCLNIFLNQYVSYLSIGFIFLAAVAIIASRFRRGPVLYFATLSAILWNFLFMRPRFTFYIDQLEDFLMFLMYFMTAVIIGNLTTRLRIKELFLRKREKNLEELYLLSKILNTLNSQDEIIHKSMDFLRNVFSTNISVYLKGEDNNLSLYPYEQSDFTLSEKEWNEALWCFTNKEPVGKDTETMTMINNYYIPLSTQSFSAGVLIMRYREKNMFSIEEENLLSALISQIITAIERNDYLKTQQKIKLAEESEKLYGILLNSISHELRTPITTISTAASGMLEKELGDNREVRHILSNDIIDASDRLNRIVDNLLGSLRIESGRIRLNLEWYDISELVSAVCRKLEKQLKKHNFITKLSTDLPMVKFDFMLMEQLLSNLLYNAVLHTPLRSEIALTVFLKNNIVTISVDDNGYGVPEPEKEKIFNKFYRVQTGKSGGLGLGLSICKEIAEIHNGTIHVEDNNRGGASFVVGLPFQQSEIRGDIA